MCCWVRIVVFLCIELFPLFYSKSANCTQVAALLHALYGLTPMLSLRLHGEQVTEELHGEQITEEEIVPITSQFLENGNLALYLSLQQNLKTYDYSKQS